MTPSSTADQSLDSPPIEQDHGRDVSHAHGHDEELSPRLQIINLLAVVIPFLGLIGAMILLWGYGFGWTFLGLLIGFYVATSLGITVGFHRLFTHRAFETYTPIKAIFAILGSMAVQGALFEWVGGHRRHHQHSDEEGDPHSPHLHDADGIKGILLGLYHSHMGWLLWARESDDSRYVGDLRKDRTLTFISNTFVLWAALGFVIPAILGGVITRSWSGVLLGFLWGGLVRVLLVHHVTWSVNSVCHLWGAKEFRSHDESRNNPIVGVLGFGEGWHNTHHAFPTSARHGLSWWQLDMSYMLIRTLKFFRLAWNVKQPSPAAIEAKRVRKNPIAQAGPAASPAQSPGTDSRTSAP